VQHRLATQWGYVKASEPKPVGYMYVNKYGECEEFEYGPVPFWDPAITLLYAAPPKREWVGLTDEEIDGMDCVELKYIGTGEYVVNGKSIWNFAKAIEAKLKEKNCG
jgi:hypothetical protein